MVKYLNNDGSIYEGEYDIEVARHTASHVMAQAIYRLYGSDVKFAIGPSISTGFYYDIDGVQIKEEDLEKIEEEMKKILKENQKSETFALSKEEALKREKELGQIYKQEMIEEKEDGSVITFFKQGDFVDMCRGPHMLYVKSMGAYKLLSVTGAYWRGDEHNKMLTRIYGTCFEKKEEVEEFLRKREEAKLRDHRKIGKDMELFMTHELVGSGLPLYLPNGATIRRILERYIQDKELSLGYKHVYTPSLANVALYKTSGHWDHYKDDMFPMMKMENEEIVLRPMNCPHHMLIYKNKLRSYKDLPIKIGELANDFRYEASGTCLGLERVRQMCQNDAHLFVRPDQIKEEVGNVLKLIVEVYQKDFGFPAESFKYRLSLRDKNNKEKYIDNDAMWETAEEQLRQILNELNIEYYEAEGEAAFYGPKIDIQIRTALDHDITIPTCQLDFALPERFELEYVGSDGEKHRPVVIHRAILGSSDRFISFLIEETKGELPIWLAPTQVKILSISDNQNEYANKVASKMQKAGIRVEVDDRNEKIGYKIREAKLAKIPYICVIGKAEEETDTISVKDRKDNEEKNISVESFVEKIKELGVK